ncbi:MAG: division/cell wall cluster transcriptional repressor MraZ [Acidobacteriota bacterium]
MRGNSPAKVDAQGRIKIPANHRKVLDEDYGPEVFVTSVTGENALIYPLSEWEKIEAKLQEPPKMLPEKVKFLRNTSYYGQVTTMDKQGRILIPQHLRESASIDGDVAVMGQLHFLEVWNREKVTNRMEADPYTRDDAVVLAELGI